MARDVSYIDVDVALQQVFPGGRHADFVVICNDSNLLTGAKSDIFNCLVFWWSETR